MTDKRTLIIFGATGDLASRLLLPGLGTFLQSGRAVAVQLIGTGRSERSPEKWKDIVTQSFARRTSRGREVDATIESSQFIQGDPTDPKHLKALLAAADCEPILYFALPPQIASDICEALEHIELPEGTTLAFEKPFGTDVASAQALNETVLKLVPEDRIHRTDHFLGRSTVLNIIGLRFANRLFEPIWNTENIEKVDIFYDEILGLEDRAQYYDKAGAMVDMIQTHLLQILAIVTMDAPAAIDAVEFRSSSPASCAPPGSRATTRRSPRAARSTRPARSTARKCRRTTTRTASTSRARPRPSPRSSSRSTPSLGRRAVHPALRQGHGEVRKEVLITFKPVPRLPAGLSGRPKPDTLRIEISPDEIELGVDQRRGQPVRDGPGHHVVVVQPAS